METPTGNQLEQAIITLQQCIRRALEFGLTEEEVIRVTRNTTADWARNTTATS